MVQCYVCGEKTRDDGRTYHVFPINDPILLRKWLDNIDCDGIIKITPYTRICSDHFERNQLCVTNTEVTLMPGSIPTVFKKYKKICAFCHSKQVGRSKSFYSFPMNNKDLLEKWLFNMRSEDFKPDHHSSLCSDHFLDDQFRNDKNRLSRRLKQNAIPTLFEINKQKGVNEKRKNDNSKDEAENCKRSKNVVLEDLQVQDNISALSEFNTCSVKNEERLTKVENQMPTKCNDQSEPIINSPVAIDLIDSRIEENIIDGKSVESQHNYHCTEEKLKSELEATKKQLYNMRHKLRVSNQKVKRLQSQLFNLRDVVQTLTSFQTHFLQ